MTDPWDEQYIYQLIYHIFTIKHIKINHSRIVGIKGRSTPPKTNMEPENEPLEGDIPMKTIIFRFHVSFRGCTTFGAKILVTSAWQDLTYGYLIKDGLVVRFRQCSGTEDEVGVYFPDPQCMLFTYPRHPNTL